MLRRRGMQAFVLVPSAGQRRGEALAFVPGQMWTPPPIEGACKRTHQAGLLGGLLVMVFITPRIDHSADRQHRKPYRLQAATEPV